MPSDNQFSDNTEDYEKEQFLGLATFARTVAGAIVVLGIFVPFFKGDAFAVRQFVLTFGVAAIWLAVSADLVALAYRQQTHWMVKLTPFIFVVWIAFWLMRP